MHGTRAAQAGAATEFCSREFKRVSQNPEQRRLRGDAYLFFTAIQAECDVSHVGPSLVVQSCFAAWTTILLNLRKNGNGGRTFENTWRKLGSRVELARKK